MWGAEDLPGIADAGYEGLQSAFDDADCCSSATPGHESRWLLPQCLESAASGD